MILSLVSAHPALAEERGAEGRLARALERDGRLRGVRDRAIQPDGRCALTEEVVGSFRKVFTKTVQGLFFGLYNRVAPPSELTLLGIEDRRTISPLAVAQRYRPPPLQDITDEPLSAITPSSWHTREPIIDMELQPVSGQRPAVRRIFRLVRDTPIEWFPLQKGIFDFTFVKQDGGMSVCVMDVWETLVVSVAAPWPGNRGPLLRGRKNRFSRERTFNRS
jgi:hypothetical protein